MPFEELPQSQLPDRHDFGVGTPEQDGPNPTGPPIPVKRRPFQFTLRSLMLGTVACGGVFAVLSRSNTTGCMGATRSSRLEWQNRQWEIEQAEQALPQGQNEGPQSIESASEETQQNASEKGHRCE